MANETGLSRHLYTEIAQQMYSYTECGYVERAIGCAKVALAYDVVNLQRAPTPRLRRPGQAPPLLETTEK